MFDRCDLRVSTKICEVRSESEGVEDDGDDVWTIQTLSFMGEDSLCIAIVCRGFYGKFRKLR